MASEYRYPTIGELWRFIFECTGIWAFSENKGSLQTRLRRLASEELFSLKSQADIEEEFRALLNGLFNDEELSSAVMTLIDEVMMSYSAIIASYMAQYTKEENIKYLLCCSGVGRLALSTCKQLAKLRRKNIPFGVSIDLFTPDFAADGAVVYPLSKMLSFLNNINLSNKSSVAKKHGETSADSVRRYLNRLDKGYGKKNLENLFEKLKPLLYFKENQEIENYLKFLVFIAYTSEESYKKIDDKRFLSELVNEFVRQFQNINSAMNETLFKMFSDKEIKQASRDQWDDVVDRWASDAFDRLKNFIYYVSKDITVDNIHYFRKLYSDENREGMVKNYELFGKDAVCFSEWYLTNHFDFPAPYDLIEADADLNDLNSLFRSKTDIDTYRKKVDLFKLKHKKTLERYPWISEELDSDIAYLENDFDRSKEHISRAFGLAKYSAGSGIVRIIARAFELSARCGDRELFRQVYKWGKYTENIKIFGGADGCYKIYMGDGSFVIVTDNDAFEKVSEYYLD